MFRTLSTLLFQSCAFGCLCVFLSLGSVEVLEDGRVVVTLCECDGIDFGKYYFPKHSRIEFSKINSTTPLSEETICCGEIKRTEWNKSPEIIAWIRTKAPHLLKLLPKKYHYFDHFSFKVAVAPEDLKKLDDAKNSKTRILITYLRNPPTHPQESEKVK